MTNNETYTIESTTDHQFHYHYCNEDTLGEKISSLINKGHEIQSVRKTR